ncbi:MAG: MotA/TolQ/ExbB proton channel family protein [Candidatus Desulfofervidaceae bacterium]|nr:MotA/TolQ/ExbB proton channel family protein [Candidatus Desulfofervidaceae bacterium]
MDIATLLGIFSAFGLMIMAILQGGKLTLFIDIPSALIVFGGTIGATLVDFPLKEVLRALKVVKNAFLNKIEIPTEYVQLLVSFAERARKEGILALETEAEQVENPFLKKGLQMLVDGFEPKVIEDTLQKEIDYLRERHKMGSDVFSAMGAFAPAMGMIGTLIGLVQMLQNMSDPSSIGPAMAVALITTFYGAVLANVIFLPISGKLQVLSKYECLIKEMILEGILAISQGLNPRIVEQKLQVFLEPKLRELAKRKKE